MVAAKISLQPSAPQQGPAALEDRLLAGHRRFGGQAPKVAGQLAVLFILFEVKAAIAQRRREIGRPAPLFQSVFGEIGRLEIGMPMSSRLLRPMARVWLGLQAQQRFIERLVISAIAILAAKFI